MTMTVAVSTTTSILILIMRQQRPNIPNKPVPMCLGPDNAIPFLDKRVRLRNVRKHNLIFFPCLLRCILNLILPRPVRRPVRLPKDGLYAQITFSIF